MTKYMVYARQIQEMELEVEANNPDEATQIALSKPDTDWILDEFEFTVDYVDEVTE